MMDPWRTEWANNKKDIAYRLNSGECGGSYGDAVLILCAVLSGLAAEVWPGDGKDRKRFVELLKQFATPKLEATKISIPLLIASLSARGKASEVTAIQKAFPKNSLGNVLIGDEVDKNEAEILVVCGDAVSLKELRNCSYANLLYREVRCGYVHEYKPGKKADSCSLTQKPGVRVSYVGWIDVNNPDREPDQHIHFALEWIADLATCIAGVVDDVSNLPFLDPPQWWVEGCSVS
jgi:hypothetical protein